RRPPRSPLFPYTTLFRSNERLETCAVVRMNPREELVGSKRLVRIKAQDLRSVLAALWQAPAWIPFEGHCRPGLQRALQPHLVLRSEEHTSELQSLTNLVC